MSKVILDFYEEFERMKNLYSNDSKNDSKNNSNTLIKNLCKNNSIEYTQDIIFHSNPVDFSNIISISDKYIIVMKKVGEKALSVISSQELFSYEHENEEIYDDDGETYEEDNEDYIEEAYEDDNEEDDYEGEYKYKENYNSTIDYGESCFYVEQDRYNAHYSGYRNFDDEIGERENNGEEIIPVDKLKLEYIPICLYGVVDYNFNIIIPLMYDFIEFGPNDIFIVQKSFDNNTCHIEERAYITQLEYKKIIGRGGSVCFETQVVPIIKEKNKYGLINSNNIQLLPFNYNKIENFLNGDIIVVDDSKIYLYSSLLVKRFDINFKYYDIISEIRISIMRDGSINKCIGQVMISSEDGEVCQHFFDSFGEYEDIDFDQLLIYENEYLEDNLSKSKYEDIPVSLKSDYNFIFKKLDDTFCYFENGSYKTIFKSEK